MQKIGFTMRLKPGAATKYERRHDALWPELGEALRGAGISDYSIFIGPDEQTLFAVLWRAEGHSMEGLPQLPVMKRWWAYMADLMETHPDDAPVVTPLRQVFHMD